MKNEALHYRPRHLEIHFTLFNDSSCKMEIIGIGKSFPFRMVLSQTQMQTLRELAAAYGRQDPLQERQKPNHKGNQKSSGK